MLQEPETSTLKWLAINWMIPNLYIGNGWKSPNIHFLMVVWGSRLQVLDLPLGLPGEYRN